MLVVIRRQYFLQKELYKAKTYAVIENAILFFFMNSFQKTDTGSKHFGSKGNKILPGVFVF